VVSVNGRGFAAYGEDVGKNKNRLAYQHIARWREISAIAGGGLMACVTKTACEAKTLRISGSANIEEEKRRKKKSDGGRTAAVNASAWIWQ